ncbi:MAG: hypothetical protein KatS3mg031_0454 [Chitinophagales bacterium]|nr:MAG: hypothetical protein KatS3mg031_0454 [Chitinophagales bacterium]
MAAIAVLLHTGCTYSNKAMHRLYAQARERALQGDTLDAIIVPGVPFEKGSWSKIMKARVYWSKFLYDRGITKNIIYSGSAVYTPYIEAEIMALYAQDLGIPEKHIFKETKAEHSTENIYYSYKLAHQLGLKKIGLASDPFQTKMLRGFARRKLSQDIRFIPIVFDSLFTIMPFKNPEINYQQAYVQDFVPLTERQTSWQRFRGTLGKHIDRHAYEEEIGGKR